MLPTQLITITLMPLELIHAYYVQADLMFFFWLNCYTSSLLYHWTKQYYPLKERIQRPLYYYDVLNVALVYFAGTYSLLFQAANTYGIWLAWTLHLTHPILYIIAGIYKKLMWQEDIMAAELWHSAYHCIVHVASHLLLANQLTTVKNLITP